MKIIEKVETKISDLSSINDIEVKKHLLIENKVVPKWDNVISYYKESENKIDDSLVKYLNFENVNSTLSKNKLVRENKDFEISLMLCNELTDVNYDKFLNSCYFGWNKLNFEDKQILINTVPAPPRQDVLKHTMIIFCFVNRSLEARGWGKFC